MPKIAPRIVDGEPVCSVDCERSFCKLVDDPCIPALREQRDKALEKERQATKALVYLAGKLSTPEKMSPDWIQEALEATKEPK